MAYSYKQIKNKDYDRVIILAFSHSLPVQGISVSNYAAYETPLGSVQVDEGLVKKLEEHKLFSSSSFSHVREHSDENQIPFLQTVLGDFKIVSLHIGDLSVEEMDEAAEHIKRLLTPKTLLVASSDFTHYGAAFNYVPFRKDIKKNLYTLDGEAIRLICAKDYTGFETFLLEKRATICGRAPIRLLLRMLDKNTKCERLGYMTSGDIDGNYSRSVGYAAIAFYKPAGKLLKTNESPQQTTTEREAKKESQAIIKDNDCGIKISREERITLLNIARDTLASVVTSKNKSMVNLDKYKLTDLLKKKYPLYITLKKNGAVRGSYGFVEPEMPLFQGVMDRVEAATFYDPNQKMISPEELPEISIEITVNGIAKKVSSLQAIRPRCDGVIVKSGNRAAILMPQSYFPGAETPEDIVRAACSKAGLAPDTWKNKNAKIFVFPSLHFTERDLLSSKTLQTNFIHIKSKSIVQ